PLMRDERGSLSFAQIGDQLPFTPVRYFLLFDVPDGAARGAHAHISLQQYVVCVHGRCTVVLDDGEQKGQFELSTPTSGLYVPPMTWVTVLPESSDTVVLALASDVYDAGDYVRDYATFIKLASRQASNTN